MWLVLCAPEDDSALWACDRLRDRGLAPVELVDPESLTRATRSAHRVGDGRARFEIGLPDGRTLVSDDIDGVLNRLCYTPLGHLVFASPDDSLYAREELSALVLSWLECLAPVMINRPSPRGLCGAWRSAAEWTVLAARAGLPVSPLPLSSELGAQPHPEASPVPPTAPGARSVVVLGEHVFGREPVDGLAPACGRLARLADADLLGIDLEPDDRDRPRFAGATPLPDLRIGGGALVERLHEHLSRMPGSR
ncbi:hypothetical protein ACIGEZ_20935 [Streptomyces sp. NPDC085481]|uniref:hypothetical protein n=1 Tax=Streptomyces sp. NPDC085481 TaxID=3365727 RepID=UPI0037D8B8FE